VSSGFLERRLDALEKGDHLGILYEDPAQGISLLLPLFEAGLARGERCVYVGEPRTLDAVGEALGRRLGVRPAADTGALLLVPDGNREGEEEALRLVDALERAAEAAGFRAARVAVEMSGVLGVKPEPRQLVRWEAGLHHHLAPGTGLIAVCHYDRRRFPASVLEAALRSHPTVVLGDRMYANVYYDPPELDTTLTGDQRSPAVAQLRWVQPAGDTTVHVVRQQVARAGAEQSERRAVTLAEASIVLTSSLDLDTIVDRVAHLAVPALADWCVVDVVRSDGSVQRVAAAHADPDKARLARELAQRHPLQLSGDSAHPIAQVIRTGRSRFVTQVSREQLTAMAGGPPHVPSLRAIGLRSFMIVPLSTGERTLGAIAFATAESPRRYTYHDLGFAEALGRRAALAVENARVYAASERRRREAESLAGLGRLISESLDPGEVARRIAESVRGLLRGRTAAVLRLGPVGELRVAASARTEEAHADDLALPDEMDDVERAVRERRPVVTPDQGPPAAGGPAVLAVPLTVRGEVTGVLRITDAPGRVFEAEEIRLAQIFADHAAIAQENSRLYAQAEELAAARERVRVAQELHDVLSQVLFSIGLKLDWCMRLVSPRSPVRARMEEMRQETGFVMEQIRRLIGELSPPEDAGFFPAGLEALVRQFKELTDIAVAVRVSGDVARLDPGRQQLLRAVLQEALTNVAKHARATSAAIAVEVRDDVVAFEVTDDGAGHDEAGRAGGHYGLRQMRERVESLGGRLEHGPHPPAGFRVAGAFPLTTR